jgi:predicted RNA-binding Zn-ribbon protein involved in translation (DUF1610 family)
MTIHLTCANPNCGKALRARDDQAGKLTDCPFCGTRMRILRANGPFVKSAEPTAEPAAEPTASPAAETQANVQDGEVLDWIGPPAPGAPPRPKHKPLPPAMGPLTSQELHTEGATALNGGVSPAAPAAVPVPTPAPAQAAEAPEAPAPVPMALPAESSAEESDEQPEGRNREVMIGWLVLVAGGILVAVLWPVLVSVLAFKVSMVWLVAGVLLPVILAVGAATLWSVTRRLRRLEAMITALRSGYETSHRKLHEEVRRVQRRHETSCPRCHVPIDLTDRGETFDCPDCGLPLKQVNGKPLDRRWVRSSTP